MATLRTGLIGLLLLSLAGCGGSSAHGAASAASPSAASPEAPPSKAEATAAAQAINLTQADVGAGYRGAPHKDDPSQDADSAALAACVGGTPPSAAVADVNSMDFSKGAGLQLAEVSSDVTVMATAEQVQKDLAALKGDKAVGCFTTFISKLLAGGAGGAGVTFGPPKITTIDTPAAGTDGAFGYDVKLTAKASGLTISFDVLVQGFAVKRSEVSLTSVSIGSAFPAAERNRLLAALVKRAQEHAV